MARPGDKCRESECRGRLHVVNTRKQGDSQVQYLACNVCGKRPTNNKHVIPATSVRRRFPRVLN